MAVSLSRLPKEGGRKNFIKRRENIYFKGDFSSFSSSFCARGEGGGTRDPLVDVELH